MKIAAAFQESARVPRSAIFGSPSDDQLPLHLPSSAKTAFIGFAGNRYRQGSVVLVGINPGGGGDAYVSEKAEDARLITLLQAFAKAPTDRIDESFSKVSECYMRQLQTWNLWRIFEPTIKSCGQTLNDVAYLNWCPYRTRNDAMPRATSLRNSKTLVIEPLLSKLKPRAVIALGKKAGSVLEKHLDGEVPLYVIPRTIGDTYISSEAQAVLAKLRKEIRAAPATA